MSFPPPTLLPSFLEGEKKKKEKKTLWIIIAIIVPNR